MNLFALVIFMNRLFSIVFLFYILLKSLAFRMGTLQRRIDEYRLLQTDVSEEDVYALAKICRLLHLPQKILGVSIHNFYHAKAQIQIEPDDIVLLSACIDLACRTSEVVRPLEKILGLVACHYALDVPDDIVPMYIECIDKTEVDICLCLDFDFNFPDFYGRLETLCKENVLNMSYSRRCWIMISDILTAPVSLFFSVDDVVIGCIFVEFVANQVRLNRKDKRNAAAVDEDVVRSFSEFLNMPERNAEEYLFISAELLRIYHNKLFPV